ncbi:MAG: pantoate--beta-alanine ligase [Xanthomonadales bacterium]|nr:pantoate--beta-alanine ligase [Xanthomonadales bacterium]
MQVFKSLEQWQTWRAQLDTADGQSLGFVATMGALHAGHSSLIAESKAANSHTVVSIFINPTQFDQAADLSAYPQPLEQDLELLEELQIDAVLLPDSEQIYPDNYRYKVTESELSERFCGASREGHFDGVLTVVMRLFNLVQPTRAYFGEKDWQQLELIRGMVAAFFMPVAVVGVKTLRAQDGLALSSRNQRLSKEERKLAPIFHQILKTAGSTDSARQQLDAAGFAVDYVTEAVFDHKLRRLAAARLGTTRLIDNISIDTAKQAMLHE